MPAVVPNRYPVDYTGVADSNFIENELHTLADGEFRVFSPLYSPFFKKNIAIVDTSTGLLLEPSQYACKTISAAASKLAGPGNGLYSTVVIIDEEVSNNIAVSYQTVGGHYTTGYEAISTMIGNLLTTNQVSNNDPVSFNTVQHIPEGLPQNLHLHALGGTAGWEYLVNELEKLRATILLGDQLVKTFVLSYIKGAMDESEAARLAMAEPGTPFGDHVANVGNPHNLSKAQLGLALVQNYAVATIQQAYDGLRGDLYVTTEQVRQVVQNAVNLGMDAHIADEDNPHEVDKTDVGLALLENYAPASGADLATPVSGTLKYVTNDAAAEFLADVFEELNSGNLGTIGTLITAAAAALTAANSALTAANTASASVNSAAATIAAAETKATLALTSSNQNTVNVQNSESAAIQIVQEYAAVAVTNAETAAFARGVASVS